MPDELRGRPRLLAAPEGYRFTDSRSGFLSIINLASVADLAARMGVAIDPLRSAAVGVKSGVDATKKTAGKIADGAKDTVKDAKKTGKSLLKKAGNVLN